MADRKAGRKMTQHYEGFVPNIYEDTLGNKTIGYGFNIDDPVISQQLPEEVLAGTNPLDKKSANGIFNGLYDQAANDAISYVGEETFNNLSEAQQNVLIDMSYNMGLSKLSEFKKMKKALINKNYEKAAKEMKNSKWFGQVGRRSKNHVLQILK